VDYGNGVCRYFSRERIRALRAYLGISGKRAFIEATREWAESVPPIEAIAI
jgi:hypothetical protein